MGARLPSLGRAITLRPARAASFPLQLVSRRNDPLLDLHIGKLPSNLRRIVFARNVRVSDLAVAVLERPRHEDPVLAARAAAARVVPLKEGDIASAVLAAAEGTGIDAAVGIGGLQETVVFLEGLHSDPLPMLAGGDRRSGLRHYFSSQAAVG